MRVRTIVGLLLLAFLLTRFVDLRQIPELVDFGKIEKNSESLFEKGFQFFRIFRDDEEDLEREEENTETVTEAKPKTGSTEAEKPVKTYDQKENPRINSVQELREYVMYGISHGWEEGSFKTTDLEEGSFKTINKSLDGFYGTVRQYHITTNKLTGRKKVKLVYDINENYEVEQAIVHGRELSSDSKAIRLREACEEILDRLDLDRLETAYSKERAIHDYLVQSVEYGTDNGDDAYTAYGALVGQEAVCNGYAQAFKLLCDLAGIECRMIVGQAGGQNHAWNLVCLDKAWYHVDVTWDDPTSNVPVSQVIAKKKIMFNYLNVNDQDMAYDHSWKEADYPAAEGTYYNYFSLNGLECRSYSEFKDICTGLIREKPDRSSIQVLIRDYDKKDYTSISMQFIFIESGSLRYQFFTSGPPQRTGMYIVLDH